MNNGLDKIKDMLLEGSYTCVVLDRKNNIFVSDENGIIPLIRLAINTENDLREAYVADKIIGRAAAAIIVHVGIKECYAHLISETAIELLEENDIAYSYFKKCPTILNRDKSGICPMEKMTSGLSSALGYEVLLDFVKNKI